MVGYWIIFVLAGTRLVSANPPLVQESLQDQAIVNYRLPNNTRPIYYDIHLTTNVHLQTDFTFSGEVLIRFIVLESSRTITLHQSQLTIESANLTLVDSPSTQIQLNPFEYDSSNEFLSFTLSSESLIIGSEYILSISYNGVLRTDDFGFYRTSYVADDGTRRQISILSECYTLNIYILNISIGRWVATTHFEPTSARHGFPCYDEPALRSFFTIRITHGSTFHALSNMPIESIENRYRKHSFITKKLINNN